SGRVTSRLGFNVAIDMENQPGAQPVRNEGLRARKSGQTYSLSCSCMGLRGCLLASALWSVAFLPAARAQIIAFESRGLSYRALSHGGVTVMYAPLSLRVRDYSVFQVSISNASPVAWSVKPEDFHITFDSGATVQATSAIVVVETLLHKASRSDVGK